MSCNLYGTIVILFWGKKSGSTSKTEDVFLCGYEGRRLYSREELNFQKEWNKSCQDILLPFWLDLLVQSIFVVVVVVCYLGTGAYLILSCLSDANKDLVS